MTEEWRDIKGFEGKYKVSNFGNVLSINFYRKSFPKILKTQTDAYGYAVVHLRNRMYKVHRLVAEAFIPNVDGKDTVNHKDGNKQNNRAENLEWATWGENVRHACRMGLANPTLSQKARECRLEQQRRAVSQYDTEGNHIRDHCSIVDAARAIQRSHSSISMCIAGKRHTCGGFVWKYAEEK